jgi:hypothetical protein
MIKNKDSVEKMLARYVKENIDKPYSDLSPYYIRRVIFPDEVKVKEAELNALIEKRIKYLDGLAEKAKREEIDGMMLEKQQKALSVADDITKKVVDVFQKAGEIDQKQGKIDDKIDNVQTDFNEKLSHVAVNQGDLLAKQFEIIKEGEKSISEKIYNAFGRMENRLPELSEEIKTVITDLEEKLTRKPPEKEVEQVLIEETGQIIAIER